MSDKLISDVHPSWNEYPKLLAELDLSKNNDLTYRGKPIKVFELVCGTNKKIDWKCSDCEHEWKVSGAKRIGGTNCPACMNQAIHIDGRNSLANTHPDLAKEYQGDATKIIIGTGKNIDWKCTVCEHEWKARGVDRKSGYGCPACAGHLHSDGRNSMANTHPELAKEYQGDAFELVCGTNKKLDWKCSVCEHEWKAQGADRKKGQGCPACAGHLHSDGRNSMANTHPELAKEYQGDATMIISGTAKRLDWKCTVCEHEWKAKGDDRKSGYGCPACAGHLHSDGRNSMANIHPELAKEYQGDATKIVAGTHKRLDWKCSICDHQWKTSGLNRYHNGSGCSYCNIGSLHSDGRNSMENTHPDLAKEYQGDATKIITGVSTHLDWKCSTCEHEWKAMGVDRKMGTGCPACVNLAIHIDGRNSMAKTHPDLAKEYQGDATKIIAGTNKKLDWKCSTCEHEWKATGDDRKKGNGCLVCSKTGYDPSSIGYLYIHHYSSDKNHWLKCGITNTPEQRLKTLKRSAYKSNVSVIELEIYRFDDGYNCLRCEKQLLEQKIIRYDSGYDIDGKSEFFTYESLEEIKKLILNWL